MYSADLDHSLIHTSSTIERCQIYQAAVPVCYELMDCWCGVPALTLASNKAEWVQPAKVFYFNVLSLKTII